MKEKVNLVSMYKLAIVIKDKYEVVYMIKSLSMFLSIDWENYSAFYCSLIIVIWCQGFENQS